MRIIIDVVTRCIAFLLLLIYSAYISDEGEKITGIVIVILSLLLILLPIISYFM